MSIGDWTEQQLEQFVRQRLNLPENLRQKLGTGQKIAPAMLNGWTNYQSSLFYWLDGNSYGHIAGEVIDNGGATVAAGTVLFSLPFAPVQRVYWPVWDNGPAIKSVLVTTAGDVKISDDGPAFTAAKKVNLGHLTFPTF